MIAASIARSGFGAAVWSRKVCGAILPQEGVPTVRGSITIVVGSSQIANIG